MPKMIEVFDVQNDCPAFLEVVGVVPMCEGVRKELELDFSKESLAKAGSVCFLPNHRLLAKQTYAEVKKLLDQGL